MLLTILGNYNRGGNISKQSVVQFNVNYLLEEQGAEKFWKPALNIMDLIKTDINGMGFINILASDQLSISRSIFNIFIVNLSELFEKLPEVGDPEKPKNYLFFDDTFTF